MSNKNEKLQIFLYNAWRNSYKGVIKIFKVLNRYNRSFGKFERWMRSNMWHIWTCYYLTSFFCLILLCDCASLCFAISAETRNISRKECQFYVFSQWKHKVMEIAWGLLQVYPDSIPPHKTVSHCVAFSHLEPLNYRPLYLFKYWPMRALALKKLHQLLFSSYG